MYFSIQFPSIMLGLKRPCHHTYPDLRLLWLGKLQWASPRWGAMMFDRFISSCVRMPKLCPRAVKYGQIARLKWNPQYLCTLMYICLSDCPTLHVVGEPILVFWHLLFGRGTLQNWQRPAVWLRSVERLCFPTQRLVGRSWRLGCYHAWFRLRCGRQCTFSSSSTGDVWSWCTSCDLELTFQGQKEALCS